MECRESCVSWVTSLHVTSELYRIRATCGQIEFWFEARQYNEILELLGQMVTGNGCKMIFLCVGWRWYHRALQNNKNMLRRLSQFLMNETRTKNVLPCCLYLSGLFHVSRQLKFLLLVLKGHGTHSMLSNANLGNHVVLAYYCDRLGTRFEKCSHSFRSVRFKRSISH